MSPSLRVLLCLPLTLAVGACGSLFEKDNAPKPVKVPDFKASARLERVADFDTGKARSAIFAPVWQHGEAWAVGADGEARSWSAAGAEREVDFKAELSAGLDANDELLVAASKKGVILAVGKDGRQRWQRPVQSEVLDRPRLVGDKVLARLQDGRLLALSAASGEIVWQSEVKNPPLVLHVPSGLSVADGVVYAAFPGGKLRAYQLDNGSLLWEAWVAQPKGTNELERVTDVVGDPWVNGDQVCAVAYQGRIGCFARSNGMSQWTREFSSASGLDGDHRYVYSTDANSVVVAFDKASGRQIWKQDRLFARKLTRPTVFGRYVAVADFKGKLFLLDSDSGELAAMTDVGDEVRSPAVVADEKLLVQDADGDVNLYALR